MQIVKWRGLSNTIYEFKLYGLDHEFDEIAACFILTKIRNDGRWIPIYIGQTVNLKQRLISQRFNLPCVVKNKATHVCIYTDGMDDDQYRKLVERDLFRRLSPICLTGRQSIWL